MVREARCGCSTSWTARPRHDQARPDRHAREGAGGSGETRLHSIVLIALPCTAWCSWQALNMARGSRSN
eukprot:2624606-Heterocapsa_arctica.AAC.1